MNRRVATKVAIASALASTILASAVAIAVRVTRHDRPRGAAPLPSPVPAVPTPPTSPAPHAQDDLSSAEMWALFQHQEQLKLRLQRDCEAHGGAVCCGQGGCCGAKDLAIAPMVAMEFPHIDGELSTRAVEQVLERQGQAIARCYRRTQPGVVSVALEIDEAGNVTTAQSGGFDAAVARCVEDVLRKARFPRPHGTATVDVRLGFRRSASWSAW